jgi:hypothetical protein
MKKVLSRSAGGFEDLSVLAHTPGSEAPVAIATAGAGLLTADAIVSGTILRSGPGAAYNDTTDTAANIIAYIGEGYAVGDTFSFDIVNGVAFIGTMVAGVGVTLAGVTANAASAVRKYRLTITSPTTVTITGVGAMTA